MKSKKVVLAISILIVLVLGLACAGTRPFKVSEDEFYQKVHKLAFTPVEFNVKVSTAIQKEKQELAQQLITEYLNKLSRFELIDPATCERVRIETMKELGIEGFFDPTTGEVDEEKFASFCKYYLQKVGADAWLYVSFVKGKTVLAYTDADAYNIYHVTEEVPAVDLYANIADQNNNTLWEAQTLVGSMVERRYCIDIPVVGCLLSLGQKRNKSFPPEHALKDSNVKVAVKKTFKSLK